MQLDPVHDVQSAYRSLVRATSYPGTIVDVSREAARIDLASSLPRPLLLLAMMLLDAEVSFAIDSVDPESDATLLSQLTYSRTATADEAAFLFSAVAGADADARLAALIGDARVGTLIAPHLGATVVARVESLGDGEDQRPARATRCRLTGPGIEERSTLVVGGGPDWIEAREAKNPEYPLGVDTILFTDGGELASIPRTTRIVAEETVWDT